VRARVPGNWHLGPIWRSVRRHRVFALLILEVAVGFFVLCSLLITIRWYFVNGLPPSGHRQTDVVEVASWSAAAAPLSPAEHLRRQSEDLRLLGALPGVQRVAPISSTDVDSQLAFPAVLWTEAPSGAPPPTAPVPGITRMPHGSVVGWAVEAGPDLPEVIDLRFAAGQSATALPPDQQARAVIITRSLANALFGAPDLAIGKPLLSSRHDAARVAGVVDDIHLRSPFLYQARATAIFVTPPGDERHGRYILRTAPGQAEAVKASAERALAAAKPGGVHVVRLFTGISVRAAANSHGTVVILAVVAGLLGLCALLGNLAVSAFLVGDRRRIIGVRRALGATRRDVVVHLIIENVIPTQIGCVLGLGLTLLSLPGVQYRFAGLVLRPTDVVATVLLLSLSGVAAKLLPALRAARIPPSEAGRTL